MMWSCLVDSYLDIRCGCGCQLIEGVLRANIEGWLDLVCIGMCVEMRNRRDKPKEKIEKVRASPHSLFLFLYLSLLLLSVMRWVQGVVCMDLMAGCNCWCCGSGPVIVENPLRFEMMDEKRRPSRVKWAMWWSVWTHFLVHQWENLKGYPGVAAWRRMGRPPSATKI